MPPWQYPDTFPKEFRIELSNNETTWIEIAREQAYQSHAGEWYEKTLSSPVSARYLRFTGYTERWLATPDRYFVKVSEWEVFGLPGIELEWSAPGADSCGSPAVSYDIRWNTVPVMNDTWAASHGIDGEPSPAAPGVAESMTVSLGLLPRYKFVHFAMKSKDAAGDESAQSNDAVVLTPCNSPINADVDCNCMVNILDLIFIRLRLNQPPDTGDNWRAEDAAVLR